MKPKNSGPIVVEPPGVDPYAMECEKIRGAITRLSGLDKRVIHSKPVCAFFATSTPPSAGEVQITATWVAPNETELGGALVAACLMAMKHQSPAVFANAIARLRDLGVPEITGVATAGV